MRDDGDNCLHHVWLNIMHDHVQRNDTTFHNLIFQQLLVHGFGSETLCAFPYLKHLYISYHTGYMTMTAKCAATTVQLTFATSTTCWKFVNIDACSVIRSVGDELGALCISMSHVK
jgi:hypothetical protein